MSSEKQALQNVLNGLNEEQHRAVTACDGPTLILAGAGSGKTRVITCRIAYLLVTGKASPWEILALTFTNKAAQEMRERVSTLFHGEIRDLWMYTFHALGARLLRIYSDRVGLSSNFSIYDEDDVRKLAKSSLNEAGLNGKRLSPESFSNWLDRNKFNLVNPELDKTPRDPSTVFFDRPYLDIFDIYQRRLRENNAVDFNDLLALTARLLIDAPDVCDKLSSRFRYILVDEYQDTNRAQYHICRKLSEAHGNICVVGDEDQSIYSWRGADIRNILDFERDYPEAATYHLVQNYRSTKPILDKAACLIVNNTERRKTKELWTAQEQGTPVRYYRYTDGRDEASAVARSIEDSMITKSAFSYRDIAVFYRVHAQSRALEQELLRRRIPYRIFGGVRFFERKEIKDILAYLKVFSNPLDRISLKRVINVPPRRIGARTIEKAEINAADMDLPLYAFLEIGDGEGIGKAAAGRLKNCYFFLEKWRERFENLSQDSALFGIVGEFIDDLAYMDYLKETGKEDRVELVNEFLSAVSDFDLVSPGAGLNAFLNQATLVSDQDRSGDSDCVTLMTLHNAKGLEYPVVFIIGLDEDLLPYSSAKDHTDRIQEERRLCYVGVTRAMRQLYLTSARRRFLWGRHVVSIESRFIEEMGLSTEKHRRWLSPQDFLEEPQEFPDDAFNGSFWDD